MGRKSNRSPWLLVGQTIQNKHSWGRDKLGILHLGAFSDGRNSNLFIMQGLCTLMQFRNSTEVMLPSKHLAFRNGSLQHIWKCLREHRWCAWLVRLPVRGYFFIHWHKSAAWTVNGQKLLLLGWKQMPGQSQRLVLKPCTPQRILVLNVTTAVSLKAIVWS